MGKVAREQVLLRVPFKILGFYGMWTPMSWPEDSFKQQLYRIHVKFVFILMFSFIILQTVILTQTESIDEFTDISFLYLSYLATCFKMIHLRSRRPDLEKLVGIIESPLFAPRTPEEIKIVEFYDYVIRFITVFCNFFGKTCALFLCLFPLLGTNKGKTELPFRIWLPFHPEGWIYWVFFAYEGMVIMIVVGIDITNDCLLSGFLMQICAQMKILALRYRDLGLQSEKLRAQNDANEDKIDMEEARILGNLAFHHNVVFKYAKKVITTFDASIAMQFIVSAIVMSAAVYQFSAKTGEVYESAVTFMYVNCLLIQLFIYCFSGNEVQNQCEDFFKALYNTNWRIMGDSSKKLLLFTMVRANKPILVTGGKILVLSLESFKMILKLSYSTFNMLRSSTERNEGLY